MSSQSATCQWKKKKQLEIIEIESLSRIIIEHSDATVTELSGQMSVIYVLFLNSLKLTKKKKTVFL